MRILVTGVAGFIAPHVGRRLLACGHEVIGLDARPVEGLPYRQVVGDLEDGEMLLNALRGVDGVCHLAGVGDVYLAASDPVAATDGNVRATTQLVLSAAEAGVRRVVFASTWEVYGEPQYQPLDEQHPTRPDHPYNVTKLGAELMGFAVSKLHPIDFIALRLGTAFGTGMRPNAVFRIFADRARQGQPLTIQGTGDQFRQFTHASDIARAFEAALQDSAPAGAYNIVSEERTSIRQLAEATVARFGGSIVYAPARASDVPPALVSSAKAEDVLGWRQQTPFESGLQELFDELETRR